jgi:hypothetical protein
MRVVARSNGGHEHFWSGTHDAGMAVVFADPEAVVTPGFAQACKLQGLANGSVLVAACSPQRIGRGQIV